MTPEQNLYWPKGFPRSLDMPQTSLYYNLEVAATRYPDKPAIVFYDSILSYREVLGQVEDLAGYLQQACGVKTSDRVALYSQNCPRYFVAYYAILRAQAVVVPINPMNLAEELQYCVTDSGARTVLAAQELCDQARPLLRSGDIEHLVVHAYSDYLTKSTDVSVPNAVTVPRQELADPGITLWRDALTGDDIIVWCKQNMAAYKVPTAVEIIDELPKSGTGKINWRQLQDAARKGVS